MDFSHSIRGDLQIETLIGICREAELDMQFVLLMSEKMYNPFYIVKAILTLAHQD